MATDINDKPLRLGDLPVVKTNILENARQFDKGVVGGYSGVFPLSTASQGGIYLLPSTGKFYVCETAYNGAQISAPNSNFVELSVWKNHDRLSNLVTFKDLKIEFGTVLMPAESGYWVTFKNTYKEIPIVIAIGGSTSTNVSHLTKTSCMIDEKSAIQALAGYIVIGY